MKVEVKHNGSTATVTGVEMWRVNGHLMFQVDVEEGAVTAIAPMDARLIRGAFTISLPNHDSGDITQVLFTPTTDKEKRECKNSTIYEYVGRGYYSFMLVEWCEKTDRKTHKVLWSKK